MAGREPTSYYMFGSEMNSRGPFVDVVKILANRTIFALGLL
jgi:hypothetical protein